MDVECCAFSSVLLWVEQQPNYGGGMRAIVVVTWSLDVMGCIAVVILSFLYIVISHTIIIVASIVLSLSRI
jgi:hypothetical protein